MEWWKGFFDRHYGDVFLSKFDENAKEEVDFIEKVLRLNKKEKILDLCCGLGRHSIELAKRGYDVTGVDHTRDYLKTAEEKANESGVEIDFIHGSMKDISFDKEFDAIINMFTSFGFFKEDRENLKVLKNVSNALKKGGKFLIDVINRDWIVRNYKEKDWRETSDGGFLLEYRSFDITRSINLAKWIHIKNREITQKKIVIRMYSFHELKSMLESVGLKVIEYYGGFNKEELTFDSMKMIIISQKFRRKGESDKRKDDCLGSDR